MSRHRKYHGRHRLEDRRGWNAPTTQLDGLVLTHAQRRYLPGGDR